MSDDGADVIEVDIAEWKKLKVVELRKRVAEVGLDTKGTKAELIARVEKYLNEQEADLLEEEDLGEEEEEQEENGEEMTGEEEGGPVEEDEETEKEAAQSNGQASTAISEQTALAAATAVVTEVKPSSTSSDPSPNTAPTKLSDSERVLLRAERFGGNESLAAKKAARAQRFSLGKRSAEDMEKQKKRSERFGCSSSPVISGIEDQEKKKKRMDRFGASAISTSAMGMDEQKKRRAERFGTS